MTERTDEETRAELRRIRDKSRELAKAHKKRALELHMEAHALTYQWLAWPMYLGLLWLALSAGAWALSPKGSVFGLYTWAGVLVCAGSLITRVVLAIQVGRMVVELRELELEEPL